MATTYIILGLLITGLVIYGLFLYTRNKQMNTFETIDEKKVAVFDIPVDSVVLTLKQMHLSGKTKRLYESWAHRWDNLVDEKLPEIEQELDEAIHFIDKMQLWHSKKHLDKAKQLVDEAEETAFQIDETLQRIVDSETNNHQEIEIISNKYEELRNNILKDSLIYKDAMASLEDRLKSVESYLDQFNALMEEADYLEARDVLKDVENATESIESKLVHIPKMYALLEENKEQVNDLQEGYARLVEQQYQFDAVDIEQDIEALQLDIESCLKHVTLLELDESKSLHEKIEKNIERLYDVMEAEIEAKDVVDRLKVSLVMQVEQIIQSNRRVSEEIERVSHSYELTDNEVEQINKFHAELEVEQKTLQTYVDNLEQHAIAYTVAKRYFDSLSEKLLSIDKEQADILQAVNGLRQREKDAREQLDMFEVDLRTMKRSLEKQHLPGIKKDYLDLFFATTKRIETVSEKLNDIKVNMKDIDEQMVMCVEDVERLDVETESIIDSALLTENLIQYANRYRGDNDVVENAINGALDLYSKKYDYVGARQTLAKVLNRVEPGSVQRIERLYFEDKDKKVF